MTSAPSPQNAAPSVAAAPIAAAMVLAAGLGLRMRPITESLPKPLVRVAGRCLLDHAIDRLEAAAVSDVIVNTHHLGSLIEGHLARRSAPRIHLSAEAELLETGGGVATALSRFPQILTGGPFYVINGDTLWLDGAEPALRRLARAFDPARMDALLLLHATVSAYGYEGRGDFLMDARGRLRRRVGREIAPFLFTGVQILNPGIFEGAPAGSFSLNRLYDRAHAAGRLFGLRHDGIFYHVGTPDDLDLARRTFDTPELRAPFF